MQSVRTELMVSFGLIFFFFFLWLLIDPCFAFLLFALSFLSSIELKSGIYWAVLLRF